MASRRCRQRQMVRLGIEVMLVPCEALFIAVWAVWCIPRRFPAYREHDLSREADMNPLRRRCPLGFHVHIGVAAAMKLFHRCFAPWVAVCLICRKSALLLGQLLVALPGAGFIAGAIVVYWGCPHRAMRDSSSGVERLRIPRGRKLESAVALVFVVPVILTSLAIAKCSGVVPACAPCLRKKLPRTVEQRWEVDRGSCRSRQPGHFPWGSLARAVCESLG
ncbi:hypothetical protein CDL15_Pgr021055 [Punica granatum]|uniref:Uncharacterized protein n=1 Tax=Punica granatum TaxID=22663 RepID=A0A218XI66_PUNGR|nr:hypothetical protein CDL15_Pgr021055 [Punica granatum]